MQHRLPVNKFIAHLGMGSLKQKKTIFNVFMETTGGENITVVTDWNIIMKNKQLVIQLLAAEGARNYVFRFPTCEMNNVAHPNKSMKPKMYQRD